MAAKKKPVPRKKASAPDAAHPTFAVAAVAVRSLINMVIVSASCATTLLTLMAVLKFQTA
jgi:hypothetical protein